MGSRGCTHPAITGRPTFPVHWRAPTGTPRSLAFRSLFQSCCHFHFCWNLPEWGRQRKPSWNTHCVFLCSTIHACALLPSCSLLPELRFREKKTANSPKTLWIDESDVWSIYIEHLIFSFLHSNNILTYEVNIMFCLNYGMCAKHDAGLLVLAKI